MRQSMRQTRTFLMGMVTMALIVSLGVSAMAAYNKSMTVTYSDIKINVNGEYFTPKDVNGTVVEPFTIAGTTYLPVRAVAAATGYTVTWDQKTQTVFLTMGAGGNQGGGNQGGGSTTAPATNLVDTMQPYDYKDDYTFAVYPSTGGDTFAMGGNSYKNGLTIDELNISANYVSYNLGGKYTTMGGVIGILDGTGRDGGAVVANIYGDGVLLKSIEIANNSLPTNFSVTVTGVSALKFELAEAAGGYQRGIEVGFADLKLS